MSKFTKPFYGVKAGEIYPTQFEPGDDCPPELEAAAKAESALAADGKKPKKDDPPAAEQETTPAADADQEGGV